WRHLRPGDQVEGEGNRESEPHIRQASLAGSDERRGESSLQENAAAHSAKRGLELRPAHRSKTRFRRFAIERLLQQTHLHRGVQLEPLGTNFINENDHLPRTTGAKPQIYWAPVRESTRCSAKGAPGDRATGVEFELRCGWPFLRTFTATCRPAR